LVARARELLRQTTAVRTEAGESVLVDDSALADHLVTGDAALDLAIAQVVRLADLSQAPPVDLRDADARLRRLVRDDSGQAAQGSILDVLTRLVTRWLGSLGATPPDPRVLGAIAGGLGLVVIVVLGAVLLSGLRERFRRDLALAAAPGEHEVDPLTHL